MQISRDVAAEFSRAQVWLAWAERGVRIIVILALAWIFSRVARRLLGRLRNYTIRVMDRRHEGSTIEMEKRATTIISVLSKLATMLVWLIALVMALTEADFHIEPLIAGLGVAGLTLGLGA